MSLEEYAHMLADAARIAAFRRAIERRVGPGDVVVEVGAGLGTYGFFALRAGAARVYAIEDDCAPALEELARRQGFGDRFRVVRGHSLDVSLPERANLAIFEDFDSALLGPGLAPVVRDTARRHLLPGGGWLPAGAEVWGALVEAPEDWEALAAWRKGMPHLGGLDFRPLSGWLLNSSYKRGFSASALLTAPRMLRRLRLGDPEETYGLDAEAAGRGRRAGTAHGVCAWFKLELAEGVALDGAPGGDETVYEQGFFPLSRPLPVGEGEAVAWSLRCLLADGGEEAWWQWKVEAGGAAAEGSTFAGFPLEMKPPKEGAADAVPLLPQDLRVQRCALDAVDGRLTFRQIAHKVRAAFPDVFPGEEEALRFVLELLED